MRKTLSRVLRRVAAFFTRLSEEIENSSLTPMVRRQRLSKWKTIYDLETAWLYVGPTKSPVIDNFSSDEDI